ncbi:MAG: agmatinase [Bacillota bacterium]
MKANTLTFIGCDTQYKDAKITLFGSPFDGTTSYRPGTRFAPQSIRIDSEGLETYSPYLDKDLTNQNVIDIGDIEVTFGNTEATLNSIKKMSTTIIKDGKKPLMIGGEHLVTLPQFESVLNAYPNVRIIQFDAHTDLRNDYCGEPLSHATVIKRIYDLIGDGKIYQFGIRSGTKAEFDFAATHTYLEKFTANTISHIVSELENVPIYITIDLDVLDPSIMSGTGTPEAGGLLFNELMTALYTLKDLNIVGADVVELAPHYDQSGVSTATASKIIRELLLML